MQNTHSQVISPVTHSDGAAAPPLAFAVPQNAACEAVVGRSSSASAATSGSKAAVRPTAAKESPVDTGSAISQSLTVASSSPTELAPPGFSASAHQPATSQTGASCTSAPQASNQASARLTPFRSAPMVIDVEDTSGQVMTGTQEMVLSERTVRLRRESRERRGDPRDPPISPEKLLLE